MNREAIRLFNATVIVGASVLAGACAVPATEVAVDTMSMHKALDVSRADTTAVTVPRHPIAPLEQRSLPPALQGTLLSTPDIRLAYVYEWIDADGNRHYGEWVAIPVAGSRWMMSDGTQAAIESGVVDSSAGTENP